MNVNEMNATEAKEEILALITTIKLTEQKIASLEEEEAKWTNRLKLASGQGEADLASQAQKEVEKAHAALQSLREEIREYRNRIEEIRRQIPHLKARERSIDPDLLEQELLNALGQTEEEAKSRRAFEKLEKETAADAELEALKQKMV